MSQTPESPPPGIFPLNLATERYEFAGVHLEGVAYGIHVCIYFAALYFLLRQREKGKKRLSTRSIALVTVLFALGTISYGADVKFTEDAWIDHRDFPGGPSAWLVLHPGDKMGLMSSITFILASVLADGSMLYRLYVVWDHNLYVMVLPVLVFLATTAFSVVFVMQDATFATREWSMDFSLVFFSFSTALSLLVASGIALRLLLMRHNVIKALGSEHGRLYTSVAAMIVESAAVYAITSLIILILDVRGSTALNIVLPVLEQVVCITPELIILRVALGRAWTREKSRMVKDLSTFRANTNPKYPMAAVSLARGPHDNRSTTLSAANVTSSLHDGENSIRIVELDKIDDIV